VQRLSTVESHSPVAVPSLVQRTWLPPLPIVGQDFESQAAPTQSRSHWQALEQRTSPQALSPVQAITHFAPAWHSMSLQAPSPTQLIVHDQPAGHVISREQPWAVVQST
jgi:hypothetical protein